MITASQALYNTGLFLVELGAPGQTPYKKEVELTLYHTATISTAVAQALIYAGVATKILTLVAMPGYIATMFIGGRMTVKYFQPKIQQWINPVGTGRYFLASFLELMALEVGIIAGAAIYIYVLYLFGLPIE